MSKVLFASLRPLERAENIKAVYDAYDGDKEFIRLKRESNPQMTSEEYSLLVADDFPMETPGKCLMIGHGMGAGKTYGIDQPQAYHSRTRADLLTHCIASSKEMVPYVESYSGIPADRILPIGMPRTDAYFKPWKKTGEKRTYLFLPTFRPAGATGLQRINWERIDEQLEDDERLIVKPHMVTKHLLNGEYRHIEEASSEDGTIPYLMDADVVITDYSSAMFDALVCKKPVVLFEKDWNHYLVKRGMYCRYPQEYSRYHSQSEDALVEMLRTAEWDEFFEDRREFFAGSCDGHSVERTCEVIRRMICES